jgi:hypothetical protein
MMNFWMDDLCAKLGANRSRCRWALASCIGASLLVINVRAQVVNVTMSLDNNQISVGGTTLLHVYAEIVPAQQATADRIFSWYVDLVNSSGNIATNDVSRLLKPASDNDPRTSSSGRAEGVNVRAIYDTFINLPNAGRTNAVELFNVPVVGVSTGRVTLAVQAGTTANLSADFIVAPKGGGDPLIGGIYSAAKIPLDVVPGATGNVRVSIRGSAPGQVTISYPVVSGQNYFVEARQRLGGTNIWQALPNGPHNQGAVTDTTTGIQRFYRLRVQP